MHLKCISNQYASLTRSYLLTVGRVYKGRICPTNPNFYEVTNDRGEVKRYYKALNLFKRVKCNKGRRCLNDRNNGTGNTVSN